MITNRKAIRQLLVLDNEMENNGQAKLKRTIYMKRNGQRIPVHINRVRGHAGYYASGTVCGKNMSSYGPLPSHAVSSLSEMLRITMERAERQKLQQAG